jgi:hypothetical protein
VDGSRWLKPLVQVMARTKQTKAKATTSNCDQCGLEFESKNKRSSHRKQAHQSQGTMKPRWHPESLTICRSTSGDIICIYPDCKFKHIDFDTFRKHFKSHDTPFLKCKKTGGKNFADLNDKIQENIRRAILDGLIVIKTNEESGDSSMEESAGKNESDMNLDLDDQMHLDEQHLEPSENQEELGKTLNRLSLNLDKIHKVLVCITCRQGLDPWSLKSHFHHNHPGTKVPSTLELKLHGEGALIDLKAPKRVVAPIQYIPIKDEEGVRCTVESCGKVFATESTAYRNHRNSHGAETRFEPCRVQLVCHNIPWAVNPDLVQLSNNPNRATLEAFVSRAQRKSVAHLNDPTMRPAPNCRNENRMLLNLGWTPIVKGKNLEAIMELATIPEEKAPGYLPNVYKEVTELLEDLYPSIENAPVLLLQHVNTIKLK